ncbi:MAG: hypothetical protein KKA07_15660, partial [Bacteroidetes bacterium]|nr:hypothetical protein [Bacteroidota bacterium]
TDRNSKISNTPIRISLDALHYNPDEKQYRKAYQPIAVLLEGEFTSNYRNRIPPTIAEDPEIKFKESSMPNKMIVVADGDIIKNQLYVNISGDTSYYDLGFDKYTSKTFGNKNFVLNAVNYLCDDSNLISVRSREVKLRLLNIQKIKQQRLFWQVLNIGFPLLLIIVAGILYFLIKKRKYRK